MEFSCAKTATTRIATTLLLAFVLISPAFAQTPNSRTPPAPPADTQAPPDSTAPPPDQPKPRRRFRIGPELALHLPTDSKTRDRFGDAWFSIGIGLGTIETAKSKGALGISLRVFQGKRGDNRATLVPIGVTYKRALSEGTGAVPYVGAGINLYLVDLRSPEDDVDSGLRATGGGTVFVGTSFGDNLYFEARYLFVSQVRGFDLSGFNLLAGYRF